LKPPTSVSQQMAEVFLNLFFMFFWSIWSAGTRWLFQPKCRDDWSIIASWGFLDLLRSWSLWFIMFAGWWFQILSK
jgi:hypothetical protein